MATHHVVHHESSGNGLGFLIGTILVIGFVFFLWVWVLPLVQRAVPQAPVINVPSQIDVNVQQQPAATTAPQQP